MLGVSVVSCFIKGRARIVDVGASSEALTAELSLSAASLRSDDTT